MSSYRSRLAFGIAIWLVSTTMVLIGIGFLVEAAYLALRDATSPMIAALFTGGGAVFLGVAIAVIAHIAHNRRARHSELGALLAEIVHAAGHGHAADLGAHFGHEAEAWLKENAPRATLAAAIAGFIVGFSPGLRRALRSLLP